MLSVKSLLTANIVVIFWSCSHQCPTQSFPNLSWSLKCRDIFGRKRPIIGILYSRPFFDGLVVVSGRVSMGRLFVLPSWCCLSFYPLTRMYLVWTGRCCLIRDRWFTWWCASALRVPHPREDLTPDTGPHPWDLTPDARGPPLHLPVVVMDCLLLYPKAAGKIYKKGNWLW